MRKLLVVLSALLLVAGLTVVASASDVSFSGEFTGGGITSFTEGEAAYGYGNLYTDAEWSVDDYNTVLFEFGGSVSGGGQSWTVGAAYLESDLGAVLDLGVGLTVKTGYSSLYSSKYEVSGNAYERTLVRKGIGPDGGTYLSFDFGSATLDLGFGWGVSDYGAVLSVPEVGPATVEAFYIVSNNADFKGTFGADVNVAELGPASVAAGFAYNTVDEKYAYGFGVSASFGIASVGAGLNGNKDNPLNQVGIDLNLAPADNYGIDVGIGLSFADDDPTTTADESEAFQGADVAAYYKVGASTWYVGYLVTEQGYSYDAPTTSGAATAGGGGFYIKGDIDF